MKLLFYLITLAGGVYGYFWIDNHHPELKEQISQLVDFRHVQALEPRYNADHIMVKHRGELLKDARCKFLEPDLKMYPYLLLDVKYTLAGDKTKEGVILWDLLDGEMLLSTKEWDKTHGFGDCIRSNIQDHDYKLVSILAKKGPLDQLQIAKELLLEDNVLNAWIFSCMRKKLIVQSKGRFRLHLEKPKLTHVSETKVDDKIITRTQKRTSRLSRHFKPAQVERFAKIAFGKDFSVREATEVYLPIHQITVENPDGSLHTSYWNAFTGRQFPASFFYE